LWKPLALTITNAGSGYVEQPTVTFSGGGGSGAAAFAFVGSGARLTSIGSALELATPNGIGFRVANSGVANVNYFSAQGNSSGGAVILLPVGTDTDINSAFSSKGAGSIRFLTNASAQEQLRVAHTASAVNYVQVTGAATGASPILSVQGSDANVAFAITSKGTSSINLATNNSNQRQVQINHTASAVNYWTLTGAAAGSAPVFSVAGTDTNIDLNLTTKGTGAVKLNTGNGEQFRVKDNGATTTDFVFAVGSNFGRPVIGAQTISGSGNASLGITAWGTSGVIQLYTNNTAQEQMRVSHTASAVNYVQVTGAATTSLPIISAQGSDTNIGVWLTTKGTGSIRFGSNSTANLQFRVIGANAAVNNLAVTGTTAGVAPSLSAEGSDTNIPLVLQPKGTGALQAQQTDSTATGGNARGANAVDWQTLRGSASSVASGAYSVVGGGYNNSASGFTANIAGGYANISNNFTSFVGGGQSNTASNQGASISGGASNTASNWMSALVGGFGNTSGGAFNFIGGGQANSGTANGAVTTQSGTMNATTAVTLSGSNASIKVGQYITGTSIASNTYVAAISGTSLTLSQAASGSSTSTLSFFTPHGVVVGGGNNQATGSYSFIGGGGDAGTAANRNRASGDWSFVGGGVKNTASGIGSVVVGGGTDGTVGANTASGIASFIGGGINNNASNIYAVIVGGSGSVASGYGSTILGGSAQISNGTLTTVIGGQFATTRSISSNIIFGSGCPIAYTSGVSQAGLLVLGAQTTNATATVLTSEPTAAGTTNQVILPNNSAYYFKGSVIANVTGAANGAAWDFTGAIMRGANAASTVLMGTPAINRVAATAGATAWVIALTADTTNGGLAVTVTGAASTTIRWVCKAETTEVTF
jgi:hypothetical protein